MPLSITNIPRAGRTVGIRAKIAALVVVAISALAAPVTSAATDTIPLKSLPQNSRLAIWGDSITEVTYYPRFVEMYLLACAGRKDISVCTFGHSGETLAGLIGRQTDLDAFKPTVISFNYGMNDTQYSVYSDEKGANFDKTMHAVIAMLSSRGIEHRVIAGPDAVDDNFNRNKQAEFFHSAHPSGLTAAEAQNLTLRHFRDIGRAAAVESGSAYADLHHRMLDSYNLAKQSLGPSYGLGPDGSVHPSANGHFLIANELLKALACDGNIGTIDVDMAGKAVASAGHSVVSFAGGVVVLDSEKYPFCYNYDPAAASDPQNLASIVPYTSFSQDLSRLILKVSNLKTASADVTWGGQTKLFTREQLAGGVNLAEQFAHTPFDHAFARAMAAIQRKQDFENYMIKLTSNFNGNDNGGNIDANMIAVQAELDAGVKAAIVPVRHTIAIVPAGATNAAAPIITGTMTDFATVGQPFSYHTSALHEPSHFTASGLPKGLTINETTGEISGTSADTVDCAVALTATNAAGEGKATLRLHVEPALPDRPVITSVASAAVKVGAPFSYQIVATNSPTHYFVTSPSSKGTVAPQSSLPAGLIYDTKTGVLSGSLKTAGVYPIQLAAMNASGVTISLVTLTVSDESNPAN